MKFFKNMWNPNGMPTAEEMRRAHEGAKERHRIKQEKIAKRKRKSNHRNNVLGMKHKLRSMYNSHLSYTGMTYLTKNEARFLKKYFGMRGYKTRYREDNQLGDAYGFKNHKVLIYWSSNDSHE